MLTTPAVSICSWNLKNFSRNSRSDSEIALIAMAVARYDLVALQEIRTDDQAVKAMIDILKKDFGLSFDFIVSEPIGTERERYAFVWRTDKFDRGSIEPFFYPDKSEDFVRDPFCASFDSKHFLKNLILCTQHAIFGMSRQPREEEAKHLKDVFTHAKTKLGSKKGHVIILGDFNLEPENTAWQPLRDLKLKPAIVAPQKTTVGSVSLYDNIWLDETLAEKSFQNGLGNVFEFDNYFFAPNSVDVVRRTVSDHRPIVVYIEASDKNSFDSEIPKFAPEIKETSGASIGSWNMGKSNLNENFPSSIGVLATILMRFTILSIQNANKFELESALNALHNEFKAGVFEYVYEEATQLAIVWRADQVSSNENFDSNPMCGLFKFKEKNKTFKICNYNKALTTKPNASIDPVQIITAVSLPTVSGDWQGLSSLQWPTMAATENEPNDSGLILSKTMRSQNLLDWMLPLFFSNQTIINRLLGSSKPQIVNIDLGELTTIDVTPRPPIAIIPKTAAHTCSVFFSVYSEGDVKAVAIFNPSPYTIDLDGVELIRLTNGGLFATDSTIYELGPGNLTARTTLLLTATETFKNTPFDTKHIAGLSRMNGNDALALRCRQTVIDAIGSEGEAPEIGWTVNNVKEATVDHVLKRSSKTIFGNGGKWDQFSNVGDVAGGWQVFDISEANDILSEEFDFIEPNCQFYDGLSVEKGKFCCNLDVHCDSSLRCRNGVCDDPSIANTPSPESDSNGAAIGGGVAAVVFILIVVVILAVVVWITKKPAPLYRLETTLVNKVRRQDSHSVV